MKKNNRLLKTIWNYLALNTHSEMLTHTCTNAQLSHCTYIYLCSKLKPPSHVSSLWCIMHPKLWVCCTLWDWLIWDQLWQTWVWLVCSILVLTEATEYGGYSETTVNVSVRYLNYKQKSVDKMGQYEWGNALKYWNIVKLSYKLCISSSDRGKCLLAWIIHCLDVSLAFFFLKTRKVHKTEKRGKTDAVLFLLTSESKCLWAKLVVICMWLLSLCIRLQVIDSDVMAGEWFEYDIRCMMLLCSLLFGVISGFISC